MRINRIVLQATIIIVVLAKSSSSLAAERVVVAPDAQQWVIHMVLPRYPTAARQRHATGAGIFVMRVQIKTGLVKSVDVARTTGDADLDAAAVAALRQWRFKPGVLPSIKQILPHWKDRFETEDSLIKAPVRFFLVSKQSRPNHRHLEVVRQAFE